MYPITGITISNCEEFQDRLDALVKLAVKREASLLTDDARELLTAKEKLDFICEFMNKIQTDLIKEIPMMDVNFQSLLAVVQVIGFPCIQEEEGITYVDKETSGVDYLRRYVVNNATKFMSLCREISSSDRSIKHHLAMIAYLDVIIPNEGFADLLVEMRCRNSGVALD